VDEGARFLGEAQAMLASLKGDANPMCVHCDQGGPEPVLPWDLPSGRIWMHASCFQAWSEAAQRVRQRPPENEETIGGRIADALGLDAGGRETVVTVLRRSGLLDGQERGDAVARRIIEALGLAAERKYEVLELLYDAIVQSTPVCLVAALRDMMGGRTAWGPTEEDEARFRAFLATCEPDPLDVEGMEGVEKATPVLLALLKGFERAAADERGVEPADDRDSTRAAILERVVRNLRASVGLVARAEEPLWRTT
jgi:hypothetical protein